MLTERLNTRNYSLFEKLKSVDYFLILIIILIGAISVLIEHGGSGSSAAAPLASSLIKKIIDRHAFREKTEKDKGNLA